MLSFSTVVRNQPNKYVSASKFSPRQETREESVDYGFFDYNFETDGQDSEGDRENLDDQEKPYDCYVGAAAKPKARRPGVSVNGWTSNEFVPDETEASFERNPIEGPPQRTVTPNSTRRREDTDKDSDSTDSFMFLRTRSEKYLKCIDLAKKISQRKDVLVVVDGGTTEVALMAAALCLSGVTAGKAGQSSAAVQVATRADLHNVESLVDLVINFDMLSSLKELAERSAVLNKDGEMKTLSIEPLDTEKAQKFVSEVFKCGLVIPHELEPYLV